MRILFIGGTGNISSYCVELAAAQGNEVFVLNRGLRDSILPADVKVINCDIRDENAAKVLLENMAFDIVADFISFIPSHVEQDIRLFRGKCGQFIFLSTASAYHKPPVNFPISESTPLKNPFWKYSQDKIFCERILMDAFRYIDFPVTIIRPSHTYGRTMIPGIFGHGDYTEIARIKAGKKIIVQGDGTTLWTLTHSSDFAAGFMGLCGNPATIGEDFTITSDEYLTWNTITRLKAQAIGFEPDIIHIPSEFINEIDPDYGAGLLGDKQYNGMFDNSKLKRFVPSFNPKIPFRNGILGSIGYFKSKPELCVENQDVSSLMDRIIERYLR